ncbi:hypothetical protein AAFN84_05850 [Mesorhizobium sp. CAU 1741]
MVAAAIIIVIAALFLMLVATAFRRSRATIKDHELFYEAYAPPTQADQAQIEKAAAFFGSNAINPADAAAASESDPFSTVVLRDGMGQAVGFADYYCFDRDVFDRYCNGRISVTDMFADNFLSHPAARTAPVLYVSTIFRYDFISDQSFRGRCETALLAWSLARLIREVQEVPPEGLTIYSYGDSPEGSATLRHFRFNDSGRTDPKGNPLLVLENVRREQLDTMLAKYGFLGNQCNFTIRKPYRLPG